MTDSSTALRQAFGPGFTRSSRDGALAAALMDGNLHLAPHPAWALPADPQWDENPFDDRNWQFQYHSLRWLDPLRRVATSADSDAGTRWEKYVRSWLEANPATAPRSAWAWTDMGTALRTLTLVLGSSMVGEQEWLMSAIADHGRWLVDENNLGHANHALHQHQALFVAGCALGIGRWQSIAEDRLREQLVISYDQDGVNEEGSIAYHENNYHWWKLALKRLVVEGREVPPEAARIDRALELLAHATRPDGTYERIGDTESGGPSRLSSPAIDYITSGGDRGTAPDSLTKLSTRGYVFGRSGWGTAEREFSEETFYSISFGRADRVHGHQDGGSLTFYGQSKPWLIDTGKFAYGDDVMRTYVLGRSGHNVVVIEGQWYDRSTDVVLEHYSLSPAIDDFHFADRGYPGATIHRRITYVRDLHVLVVQDTVRADRVVTATQLWHVDAETLPIDSGYLLLSESSTAYLEWVGELPNLSSVRGVEIPFEGWTSTGWRERTASPVVKAAGSGREVSFRTVISLGTGTGSVVEHSGATDENLVLRDPRTGGLRTLTFSERGVTLE